LKIANDLVKIIEKLLMRSDEEETFDEEIVNPITESIGVMLNYWDCFDTDYQKETIPLVIRERIHESVLGLAKCMDNLERETETLVEDKSKRQLHIVNEWILDTLQLLQ